MNKEKTKHIAKKILKITALGVLITAASLLAPQLPYLLLKSYLKHKFNTTYSNRQLSDAHYYLKRKKFIAYEKRGNKWRFLITKMGKKHLKKEKIENIKIPKTKWDGQWRLLTFDIPESHRSARHTFRKKLKELGFYHFQRSVFILPYPCLKEVKTITEYWEINPYAHVLTTDRFEGDKHLIKLFNL